MFINTDICDYNQLLLFSQFICIVNVLV